MANGSNIMANSDKIPIDQGYLSGIQELYGNVGNPLYEAQQEANERMAQRQNRKPMVFEFYLDESTPISVEMYINPQRMQFSEQKIIGKSVTRGGIFYHHWGEDNPTLQLSGTVGLSGMKGIEQIEKIYHYSGTLLRYKDVGIHYGSSNHAGVENFTNKNEIKDFYGLDFAQFQKKLEQKQNEIVPNKRSKISQTASLKSDIGFYNVISKINDNKNNLISSEKRIREFYKIESELFQYKADQEQQPTYQQLNQFALKKINNNSIFNDYNDSNKTAVAVELASAANSPGSYKNVSRPEDQTNNDVDTGKILNAENSFKKNKLSLVKSYNDETKETFNNWARSKQDATGWEDIEGQVLDPWRPRQIFIYFEDRVYIGFFENFSWNRVAEHPLIQYDIRFIVTRQIIITSNLSNKHKNNSLYSDSHPINSNRIKGDINNNFV